MDSTLFEIAPNTTPPASGRLLLSEPFMRGEPFERSVILLIEHTPGGSMGLIINKRLPFTANALLPELAALPPIPLYNGGPVDKEMLFFLHTFHEVKGAVEVLPGLYLNGDLPEILSRAGKMPPAQQRLHLRFFLGYSGWAQGQLEQEIQRGHSWLVSEADVTRLLHPTPSGLWRQSVANLGGKYRLWSKFPLAPSLN